MSQLRYTLLGDSNIRRSFNSSVNRRACPALSKSTLISCCSWNIFDESLSKVDAECDALIVSCITNFLADSDDDSSAGKRVEPVIKEFKSLLLGFSEKLPGCNLLVAPPMYRTHPVWYRDGLPEILTRFSSLMSGTRKIRLLPSFATPDFEADGIHLTSYSGLEYIIHLFDSVEAALSEDKSDESDCDERFLKSTESARLLEDRMMALEQDHRRLNRSVEYRAAVDAELHDFHENVGNEDFLIITGQIPMPASGLSGPEWQRSSIESVQVYLSQVLGRPANIKFIQNLTGRSKDSVVRYQVKLASASESKEIRSKFGYYFAGGTDNRPPLFKDSDVTIRNRVTHDTRVRIAILQVLAKRYKDSNAGSKASVVSYEPRPLLRITPPSTASDRRSKSFNFVEAVKKFPTNFTKKELGHILPKIGKRQFGNLKSVFICLSDDLKRPVRAPEDDDDQMDVTVIPSSGATTDSETEHHSSGSRPETEHRSSGSRSGTRQKRGPSPSGSRSKSARH